MPITASSGQRIRSARPAMVSSPALTLAVSGSGDMDRTRNASLVRLGRLSQLAANVNGPASAMQAWIRSSPLATRGA